ncbi:MAG: RNA polymerase sigma factor [Coprobacillaceae bacterium]
MDKREELTQIVETVQKDMEQFELLYSHVINKVYYWCYNIVNDEATAKDLAQESMIRIYQKLHTLDNAQAFHSWMYVLVRNICYSYLRLHKNTDTLLLEQNTYIGNSEDIFKEERVDNLPEEAYNLKATKQLIISFVEKLPTKQKEIIMLFYLEELTTTEIAEILDYNVVTVRTHLYYGRKNLEKQIDEYQEKNKTKLYSSILLPLLGSILQEHYKRISGKQNIIYNKNDFRFKKLSRILRLKNSIPIHMDSIISTILIITIISLGSVVVSSTNINNINNKLTNYQFLDNDLEMLKKVEGNPYVESITYYTFPTRNSTPVSIKLKKDMSKKNIKIVFGDKDISFNKQGNIITISAEENGEYVMIIGSKETSFIVDTIDKYAPEVTSIKNCESYLQLSINDELSQINHEKSYVFYHNKKFPITNDNQVKGTFKGNVAIYIFNDLEQYIYYEIEIK